MPVVTFFWDDPPPGWISALAAASIRVWIQVGSPEEAREAVGVGADTVIAQIVRRLAAEAQTTLDRLAG